MNACPPAPPDAHTRVTLDPAPGAWARALQGHLDQRGPLTDDARAFRAQLALDPDRPVGMAGHQAGLWHPGILTKLIAAQTLARRLDAQTVWLVVDQDANPSLALDLPTLNADGRLVRATWDPAGEDGLTSATARRAAVRVGGAVLPNVPDELKALLERGAVALDAHADAPSRAAQATEALFDLLADVADRPRVIYTSELARTDLFARTIEQLRENAELVFSAYNRAVERTPASGVRPLRDSQSRGPEVPVWIIDERGQRRPAHADDLRDARAERLLPRGMLMTALVRAFGADLFIHGTGGRAYEPVNDLWAPASLGWPALSPFACASGDLTLDLEGAIVTERDAAQARARAHRARHFPGVVGDDHLAKARDEALADVNAQARGSSERLEAYRALHQIIAAHRAENAGAIARIEGQARDADRAARDAAVRTARDWSVALHAPERLIGLADRVRGVFEG